MPPQFEQALSNNEGGDDVKDIDQVPSCTSDPSNFDSPLEGNSPSKEAKVRRSIYIYQLSSDRYAHENECAVHDVVHFPL
jgi:hypothetical protein